MTDNDFNKHLICWQGSKRLLRKYIVPLILSDIHSYIEPFGGSGAILFSKHRHASLEIYNDIDSQLVNLFRVVKYHKNALMDELSFLFASREQFNEYLVNKGETDIQKAARFLFIVTRSFGGLRQSFGTKVKQDSVASSKNIIARIPEISERLDRVIIENLSFEHILLKYDHEKAFFYCDPPYINGKGYEAIKTKDFKHELLAELIKNIKGYFCLSYDDNEKVRSLYKDYNIIEIARITNPASYQRVNKYFKEVIITNYDVVYDDSTGWYRPKTNFHNLFHC